MAIQLIGFLNEGIGHTQNLLEKMNLPVLKKDGQRFPANDVGWDSTKCHPMVC